MNKMNVNRIAIGVALAAALSLTGCATVQQGDHTIASANQAAMQRLHTQLPPAVSPVLMSHRPYLVGSIVKTTVRALPRRFYAPVTLMTGSPWTLAQIASKITQITGMPSRISYSAQMAQMQMMGSLGIASGGAIPPPPGVGLGGQPALPQMSGASSQTTMRVSWSGSLQGLLNLVASRANVFWRYRHGAIVFFLTETQVFRVALLPGSNTYQASVTNQGNTGNNVAGSGTQVTTGQSQTSQTVSSSATLDTYSGITQSIQALLARLKSQSGGASGSALGGQTQINTAVIADPATGTVTVTATPPLLRAVAQYIRSINERMTRQVLISVHVYDVTLGNSETMGLNLQAAFDRLDGATVNLTGATPPGAPAGQSGATISAILPTTSPWNGSQIVAQALATQGDVSLVTSAKVLALDDQPAPLQVGSQIGYLASSSAPTITSTGTTPGQLTPGSVTVGFSANFLPMVIDHNRVLLGYSIDLSQLESLQTVTSGSASIQTPSVSSQSIFQRALLKSGQTLVLSGFEQTGANVNRSGTGAPGFWEAGGGVGVSNTHKVLVIAIGVQVL